MTDLRKAAEIALQTLYGWEGHGNWAWPESALEQAKKNTIESIQALRQALAQPEQEPIGFFSVNDYGNWEQNEGEYGKPLYAASPKREWVGYTNEDRERIVPVLVQSLLNHDDKTMAVLLKAILIDIEQQLKEKNKC